MLSPDSTELIPVSQSMEDKENANPLRSDDDSSALVSSNTNGYGSADQKELGIDVINEEDQYINQSTQSLSNVDESQILQNNQNISNIENENNKKFHSKTLDGSDYIALKGPNDGKERSTKSLPLLNKKGEMTQSDWSMMSNINAYVYPDTVYREVIIVTISIFMGYASLVVVQKKLYNKWVDNHENGVSNEETSLFEHGTSLVYVGNLLFRLLHNFFFGTFAPRHRVGISLIAIFSSMFMLSFIYFWLESTSIVWVYIFYLLGGVGVGTFEANLLATITPLGPDTKVWALIGMPAGFTLISVFGYALMGFFDLSVVCLYLFVSLTCIISMFIWYLRIPIPQEYTNNNQTIHDFIQHFRDWRYWAPNIKINCLALCGDMFCVSFFSAINQYILTGNKIPLFGSGSSLLIETDDFFSVYSLLSFMGDASGRKLVYYLKLHRNPLWYLILSFSGAILCILKIPILTWIGYFLIFLANGLIYASTTRRIDGHILKQWSLTSLSIWLFVGDIGSVTGSNVWQYFKPLICSGVTNTEYFCGS